MNKIKPTDSQIDVLMSDWLGNLRMKEEGNYIHKGKGGIRKKEATSMRRYLIGDVSQMDKLDLMKNARIASEKIVNTLAPNPVMVQVGKDESCHGYQNGREVISIATDYFDDPTLTKEEKVDIMLGLSVHEAAHAAYTDSSLLEENLAKEPQELQQLKKTIWNIIEDERIEYHAGEDRPGLIDCVGKTKGYYFDKLVNNMKVNGRVPTEPLPKLINAITQAIRYPSEMTREQVEENFDDLDEIRRTLTPYPLSSEDCWEAAGRVMDVVKKHAKKELEEQQQQQQQQQEQSSQPQQQTTENNGNQSQDQQQQPQSKASGGQEPTEQEVIQAVAKALGTEQGKKVMEAIAADINKSDASNESSDISYEQNNQEFVNNDDYERMSSGGDGAGGGNPDVFIKKPKGDPNVYNDCVRRVRQYVPAMAKVLTCKSQQRDYVLRSQPKGKLDTNKLVAYRAGSDKIFTRTGSITCSSASVCMLIDESGSMDGKLNEAAREAAILVNEAIKRIKNVNFYCYGFTSEQINVYSENNRTSKWALSGVAAIAGTPTGMAMEVCSRRVRRFTSDPVLMLILTDGHPHDRQKVIEQDSLLRKKGFTPIGVGIMTNAVQNLFKENIIMMDISDFPMEMGKLTKNRLNKMMVRTDSED